jgi:hypothetical protein
LADQDLSKLKIDRSAMAPVQRRRRPWRRYAIITVVSWR